MSAALLVRALRQPATVEHLDAAQWNGLIAAAKAEAGGAAAEADGLRRLSAVMLSLLQVGPASLFSLSASLSRGLPLGLRL